MVGDVEAPIRLTDNSAAHRGVETPQGGSSVSSAHGPNAPHVALDHLTTEARNPASEGLDGLSTIEIVRVMNSEDARVAEAVSREAKPIATVIDVLAERLARGGRLIYTGAGTSGRLGVLDAAECPPTFNTDPSMVVGLIAGGHRALLKAVEGAEDSQELGAKDLEELNLSADDVVVGIATSGRTPYVIGGLRYAAKVGAYTVALSCNAKAEIIPLAETAITVVVGPEVLSGSTRLKAGTATKLVLNTITTGVMVKMGKTFGNLMVDLRPTNHKLQSRAIRIVRQATGLDHASAQALLADCQGEVKLAIVAQLTGSTPDEARKRLVENQGHVGQAVSQ